MATNARSGLDSRALQRQVLANCLRYASAIISVELARETGSQPQALGQAHPDRQPEIVFAGNGMAGHFRLPAAGHIINDQTSAPIG